MLLFKIAGLLLVVSASTFLGFHKANSLIKRSVKLNSICVSLSKLAQLVRSGAGELEVLFSLSFESGILCYQGKRPVINKNFLSSDDINLFKDFLNGVGMSDSESEYKRITVFKALFEKQASEAEKKSGELSKLYNTLGFLAGLAVCIFLI